MEWVNMAIATLGVFIAAATLRIVWKQERERRQPFWWARTPLSVDGGNVRVVEVVFTAPTTVVYLELVGAEMLIEVRDGLALTGPPHGVVFTGDKYRFLARSDHWPRAWIRISTTHPGVLEAHRWAWMGLDEIPELEPGAPTKRRWYWTRWGFVRLPRVAEVGPGAAWQSVVTPRDRARESIAVVLGRAGPDVESELEA